MRDDWVRSAMLICAGLLRHASIRLAKGFVAPLAASIPLVVARALTRCEPRAARESLATRKRSSSRNAHVLAMHEGTDAFRRESAHAERRRTRLFRVGRRLGGAHRGAALRAPSGAVRWDGRGGSGRPWRRGPEFGHASRA